VSGTPGRIAGALRLTSLRMRLVVVFALVALIAAAAASGIAYWINRDAVLTRAQNAALNDFRWATTPAPCPAGRGATRCGTRPRPWPTAPSATRWC